MSNDHILTNNFEFQTISKFKNDNSTKAIACKMLDVVQLKLLRGSIDIVFYCVRFACSH